MIRIGILDISQYSDGELISLSEKLSKAFGTEKKKNKKANAQSIFARLLLTEVYKTFENSPMPKITKDEKGKPCFLSAGGRVENNTENEPKETLKTGKIFFNISHDDGMVAVSVSDTSEVGIDLQSKKENMHSQERIEKMLSSFLDGVDFSDTCESFADTEILFYRLNPENGELLLDEAAGECIVAHIPDGALSDADAEFLRSWTRLESLLKLSGGGFADTGEVKSTALSARAQSIFVKNRDGKVYSLTLSCFKK